MKWFPLLNYTHYSLQYGFSKPKELAKKCKENSYPACGIADYKSISGAVSFYKACIDKADQFKTSVKIAKTMLCKNCAAFIQKPSIMNCIEKGLAAEEEFGADIMKAANLGYCELFDFKCAGDRTCDAWIVNGPIK